VSFLLDTNVMSEWVKPKPDPQVVRWLADVDEDRVHVTVASFAEIRFGIERLPPGARRERLDVWLRDELPARFEGRVFDIDQRIAHAWGKVMARARRIGRELTTMDACFAATAETHALTLVTRNTAHFGKLGLSLLNPWTGAHEPGTAPDADA
jgi:predicted nucleic acid-binding protein